VAVELAVDIMVPARLVVAAVELVVGDHLFQVEQKYF